MALAQMARLYKRYVSTKGLLNEYQAEDIDVLTGAVGVAYQRAAVAGYGVDGPLWGSLRSAIRSDRTVHSFGLHGPVHM
jgi:hypothetical protein